MNKPLTYLRRLTLTVWIIILVLVVVRILLPTGIKYGINWFLENKLESYQGRIDDFDLALYRGAYQIEDLKIWKKDTSKDDAFIHVEQINAALVWKALFDKRILADVKIQGAHIYILDTKFKEKKKIAPEKVWRAWLDRLVPLKIETFYLLNSSIEYSNPDLKTPVTILVDDIDIQARNIENVKHSKDPLPTTVEISARLQKDARIKGNARLNLTTPSPQIDGNLKMDRLNLAKFNNIFSAYGPITFKGGYFSVYSEIGIRNERYKGYIKPFFEDLDVISPNEKFESPKQFFAEMGAALGNLILRNEKNKTVATKIDFEGTLKDQKIDTVAAFWKLMSNAFIEAIKKSIEGSISLKDVPKEK